MLAVCRKTRRLYLLCLALTVVVALNACGTLGSSQRLVVYVSEVDGNADIYTVDADSGESNAVKRGPNFDFGPVWSPDGERIAFVTDGSGNRDVNVILIEGQGGTLSVSPEGNGAGSNEGAPLWNLEGDRIAYVSDFNGEADIYVSGLEGGGATRITSGEGRERLGDWSPDGQWLVFSRHGGDDKQGLWLRNPGGVNLLQLTDGADSDPAWSSDGDVIAFVRDDFGNRDIYLVRPEDGDDWRSKVVEERWLNSPEEDHSPAWAPNGDTLVFVTTRDGNAEIYVANAGEDAPPQRLTINEAEDTDPVWSPDGNRIAFVTDLFGEGEILVMEADGTKQQRLTHNDTRDHSPDW